MNIFQLRALKRFYISTQAETSGKTIDEVKRGNRIQDSDLCYFIFGCESFIKLSQMERSFTGDTQNASCYMHIIPGFKMRIMSLFYLLLFSNVILTKLCVVSFTRSFKTEMNKQALQGNRIKVNESINIYLVNKNILKLNHSQKSPQFLQKVLFWVLLQCED